MVAPWRQAGLTYIRYSQICAQALRNSLRSEFQEAARRREARTVIFRKWDGGKPQGNFVKE